MLEQPSNADKTSKLSSTKSFGEKLKPPRWHPFAQAAKESVKKAEIKYIHPYNLTKQIYIILRSVRHQSTKITYNPPKWVNVQKESPIQNTKRRRIR